jgi:hypothetical protein
LKTNLADSRKEERLADRVAIRVFLRVTEFPHECARTRARKGKELPKNNGVIPW